MKEGGLLADVTITDIAKKAGVSSATVSRTLNNSGYVKEETRKRVLKAMKELDYAPSAVARSLSKNQTNIIGMVVPDINNPFFCEVFKGVSKIADKHNLNIILCDTDEDALNKEIKYLRMLKEQRIRGLIITPTSEEKEFNSEYLGLLESLGIPIVLVDRDVKYSNFDGVFLDNIKGAFEGTEALIKEGHKKIAIIAGPTTSKPGRDRLRGYKKALQMNNIPVDKKYIFYGDFKLESGYNLTRKILRMKDRPTALFTSNNLMSMGCIKAMREEKKKVPEDMALVCFDEVEAFDVFDMSISVISRPTTEMGRIAMEILLERMNENSSNNTFKRITLSPQLILKGSEKFPKKLNNQMESNMCK